MYSMNYPKGKPKISVCIATYKRAELSDCLDSIRVKNRLCPYEYEIIVCDDDFEGSALEVCRYFRATYIWNPSSKDNKNPAKPRFLASKLAQGELIVNMSDDCLFISEEPLEAFYLKVKEKEAVFATVLNVDTVSREYIEDYTSINRRKPYFFCGAVKRSNLEKVGWQDLDYVFPAYDDDELAVKLSKIGVDFVFDSDILAHHLNLPKGGMSNGVDSSVWYHSRIFERKNEDCNSAEECGS